MKTYITADDFGLNSQVNHQIMTMAKAKQIDLISLLVNGKATQEAVRVYKRFSPCPIGLHFNLIEGQPLSDPKLIPSLLNKKGEFNCLPIFLTKLLAGKIKLSEVELELNKQLGFFKANQLKCYHLNSHQNFHIFQPIFNLISQNPTVKNIKLIRQKPSINKRLRKYPLKNAFVYVYSAILNLLYGKIKQKENHFDEEIVHPGTYYDNSSLLNHIS